MPNVSVVCKSSPDVRESESYLSAFGETPCMMERNGNCPCCLKDQARYSRLKDNLYSAPQLSKLHLRRLEYLQSTYRMNRD